MDNELLIQLIQKHNRLIIPSLGAFLKKDQAGVDVIVYTPFLKKDDGILTAAISENFGTTAEESTMMIAEFVGQVNHLLEQNGSYDIAGIGTLRRDANGSIVLINEPRVKVNELPKQTQQQIVVPNPEPAVVAPQPEFRPVVVPQFQPAAAPQPVVAAQQPIQRPVVAPQPVVAAQQPIQRPVIAPQPSTVRQPMPQPVQSRVQSPVARAQSPQPRFPTQGGSSSPQPGRPMPNPASRPMPPQGNSQPQRRPVRRPAPKGAHAKLDIWLIIAIVAAVLVTALLIYGYLNTDPTIDLAPMVNETAQDSLTVIE